ncbi:MAG: SDR family NAD(P)-dependent oxidoreductase [Chthoniobacter sp.]|uniref:type I polyketide synthase n=1 Tax=Chthoniobacter sp. TaxID=2510640 RepID=UPI0032AE33AE
MSDPEDSPDIAIIGLACRFPGARNATEFWRNLASGVESITRLTDDEMLLAGVPPAHLTTPHYVKASPVLDEPGGFDAALFGYTPNEARTMDPQHRILLELAFEALEDAGCDSLRFPGRIGAFAGAAMNTYFTHARLGGQFATDYIPTLIVNDKDFLTTRLSYKLNLKGPGVTLQTACSTSLVAVHFACQSLLMAECDVALAGAISVRAPHRAGYFADAGGVSSPSGHVRAFDAQADGTVFGSGGGVLVLKRLADALAAGDTIHAVIKGSAINNDGAEKAGYTAPSVNGQADAAIEALASADVDADSISYVEAHGSGTPVGDPIEIRALTKAFRMSTQRNGFCAIGSVKTNVGHLDVAAGMAGLIKTVLSLRHREIPPSLHYSAPNPEIDFASSPFFVNTKLTAWNSPAGPRRAGVVATGMGGTNAHVILEEAPGTSPAKPSPPPKLLVLSARTEPALAAMAQNLHAFLESNSTTSLDDAAFTLQTGRRAMEHRRFVVAADPASALASLAAKPGRLNVGRAPASGAAPVMLLLPGVGDHYVGMGRELYAAFPAFRRAVDDCAAILQPRLGLDIREILYPRNRDWNTAAKPRGIDLKKMLGGAAAPPEDDDTRQLNNVTRLQPALFAIEYALARLWMSLGITPQGLVGHSMGEYVAACLAGTFSLEDSLHLIVRRTQLVEALPPARMLAVNLSENELLPLLPKTLSICLINGPSLCVVAGPPPEVEDFTRQLEARNVIFRPVKNTHAFHSRMLDSIVGAFEQDVRKVTRKAPQIPFISNVTGQWITAAEAVDPAYWSRHLNHPARFADGLRTMWQTGHVTLLEAGPGKTLGVLAMQHPDKNAAANPVAIASLRHDYENQSDVEVLLNSAGRLWLAGAEIRWEELPGANPRRKISLPTYPFEHQDYWLSPAVPAVRAESSENFTAPPGIDHWFYVPSWERALLPSRFAPPASDEGCLWLVFAEQPQHAEPFRRCLSSTGGTVRVVPLGGTEYGQLFREISGQLHRKIHIVHLGGAAGSEEQDSGFFSLLSIAQAIGELNISIPVTIGVVTSQIHEVTGEESLSPAMATVLGPCGVVPKEFPNATCFNLDLSQPLGREELPEANCLRILSEFSQPVSGDVIAFRGAYRWKRKFASVPLPAAEAPALRERGVYLITGGTGGIGLEIAGYLAQACQARLVLTKKSPFPEKSKWQELANAATSTGAIIQRLLAMEAMGAEVEVCVADVTDREQMQQVFARTVDRHQTIHGVIHTAGIVDDGLISSKKRETAEAVLAPKLKGSKILYECSEKLALDFLVLFSSTASFLAPAGQIDYAAANAYLDAFAHFASRQRPGTHALAINWPGWREVGILAESDPSAEMPDWKVAALKIAIRTEDGLECFRRALHAGLPQVIVSPQEIPESTTRTGATSDDAPSSAELAALPGSDLEKMLADIWSETLGVADIAREESFFDLGGNSLLALQLVTKLRGLYEVDITLRDFFAAPTVAQLSFLIHEKLVHDIAQLTDDEVGALMTHESQ